MHSDSLKPPSYRVEAVEAYLEKLNCIATPLQGDTKADAEADTEADADTDTEEVTEVVADSTADSTDDGDFELIGDTSCDLVRADSLDKVEAIQLPITTLAYLGDAWYEFKLRLAFVLTSKAHSGSLDQAAAYFSSAPFQAFLYPYFEQVCAEDDLEANLLRRARNYKTKSVAKHADVMTYHLATAVETVLGFWVVTGQNTRAETILQAAWSKAQAAWSEEEQRFLALDESEEEGNIDASR